MYVSLLVGGRQLGGGGGGGQNSHVPYMRDIEARPGGCEPLFDSEQGERPLTGTAAPFITNSRNVSPSGVA